MLVVLYEYETQSFEMREVIRLKVSENRLLSKTNEKRLEVRREWK